MTQEHYPSQDGHSVDEQVPHSGVRGYERPHEGAIPVTHEIPADDIPSTMPFNPKDKKLAREIQRSNKKWHERTAVRVGGAVAGIVAAVGTGVGISQSGGNEAPRADTSTSVSPNPSEVATQQPVEAVVGEPGSTLENISVKPSEELINEALEPVTVANYPTPEEALEQFAKIENIHLLSGETETDQGSEYPPTPESTALHEQLFANMFSPEGLANRDTEADAQLRNIIATKLWYINESGVFSNKTGTWHRDWVVNEVNKINKTDYSALVTKETQTNFHEIDELVYQNIPDISSDMSHDVTINLHNDGEQWFIDAMKTPGS